MKKECLPIEIRNILERKPKKEKGERKERERKVGAGDEEGAEFITEIRTRDDMTLDYSQSHIVIERLPILKQERLKGRYDPDYHVNVLDRMAEMQKDDKLQVSILLDLIAVKFSSSKGFLDLAAWNFTANKLSQLLDIISTDDFKKHVQSTLKSEKKEMNTQEKILLEGVKSIFPSLANFIESLESHQYRAFKSVQHTSLDYLHLIKNENLMLFINDKALNFVDSFSHPDLLSRIAMVKINYIYYKKDNIY